MLLTKECDYAIRVVRTLGDMQITAVKTICERELIPKPFAYKILKKLETAGILSSRRGAGGGYRLECQLQDITLYQIVRAVDERLFMTECLEPGFICPLNTADKPCALHGEMNRIQKLLVSALSETNMGELVG